MPIQQISTEYIAIDPDYCFGKPHIVGKRMPVAAIAEMYLEMGQSLEEIAIARITYSHPPSKIQIILADGYLS